MSKFIFFLSIAVFVIGGILIGCGPSYEELHPNPDKVKLVSASKYSSIEVQEIEGHTYISNCNGGIIHAQSCKCLY